MSRARSERKTSRKSREPRMGKPQLHVIDNNVGINDSEPNAPVQKADHSILVGRNPNQERYLEALRTKEIVVSLGSAGSGKTYLATAYASDRLIAKDYSKIIVTRPVLSADEDMGFLPGDIAEKFAPYFRPVYDVLLKRLGGSFLKYCLHPNIAKVEIAPFSFMRGRNFEDAVVILDEAQNVTVSQMKLFLTRLADKSQVIINGDLAQCDLPKGVKSGLEDLIEKIEGCEDSEGMTGLVKFTEEDSVRSRICSFALDLYKDRHESIASSQHQGS